MTPLLGPRPAPRHALDRAPSSSHQAVARDHGFRVMAARRRKAAAIACRSSECGQVILVEMNRADRDSARVDRKRAS